MVSDKKSACKKDCINIAVKIRKIVTLDEMEKSFAIRIKIKEKTK